MIVMLLKLSLLCQYRSRKEDTVMFLQSLWY